MAIGPRLDLRQSQSLVMTPQLRQAIKLLQFSNLEVAAYIEQELEHNPLLERAEHSDLHRGEQPAPDQAPERITPEIDAADRTDAATLPQGDAAPLDAPEHAERFDPGGPSDGHFGGRGG